MTTSAAYFVRTGPATFLPQRSCAGAWNTEELHIAPVNGLLVHELERWRAARGEDERSITRVSLDYLGVLDFGECSIEFEVLRPGRAVELVEGVLSQHGRPVLRARVWRLAGTDTSAVAGGLRPPLAPPDRAKPFDLTSVWPGEYIETIELRVLEGPEPGHAVAWLGTQLSIVEDEPVSDLARFLLLVDTANGIAVRQSPDQWQFPNLDLTIHLFAQPTGAWLGVETHVIFGDAGHGLTSSDLFDVTGHVGHAEKSLLVRPR
jgi:hypothetical protein